MSGSLCERDHACNKNFTQVKSATVVIGAKSILVALKKQVPNIADEGELSTCINCAAWSIHGFNTGSQ
ncbi:hypothetical protein [Hafnia paralvei]|jgi:hypothetical protein|uniref:hypothetical protein n=1 Tax=Hafnia paralvei TaxID=546367 RepID=UPI003C2C649B